MTSWIRPRGMDGRQTCLVAAVTIALLLAASVSTASADGPPSHAKAATPTTSPATQRTPTGCPFSAEDIAFAKECFAEAKAMSDTEGGKTWGKKLYGPFLFVDPATRGIIANGPDKKGHLVAHDGVWLGTLPESENIAFTACEWAGVRWTMIGWPPQKIPFVRKRLHAHEMFHRIQADIGLAPGEANNGHLDTREGRIWLRAEWRALRKALMSKDEDRRKAIGDALLFRRYRHSLFPDKVDDECAFEMHEGMAEYTGFVASELEKEVAVFQAGIQLHAYDTRPAFVLTFAYASGPAYGLLLDRARDGALPDKDQNTWRRSVSPKTDLGELLAETYLPTFPENLKKAALERLKAAYEGQEVIDEEAKRAREREKKLAEYRLRFSDGPTLTLAAAGRINWAYDPRKVTSFEDQGSVYETGRVTDNWGVLVVEAKGMLLVSGESGMVEKAVVPAPKDIKASPIAGDGYTLTLAEGWELKPGKRRGDYYVAQIEKDAAEE